MQTKTLERIRTLKLAPVFDSILRQALNHREIENTYDQAAHGFAIADWVYYDGANWLKADRDASSSLADGVVSHVDGDEFGVLSHGIFTQASGLTAGNTYYLSSTAGTITNTLPTSGIVQTIGRSISTTSLIVQIANGNAPAITPERVDIFIDNSSIAPAFTIEQDGTGDATMRLLLTGGQAFTIGIDNNDSDKFKVSDNSGGVGTNDRFVIDTSGDVGIGTASPGTKLEVAGQIKITGGSPGSSKVLTSDAVGLATWSAHVGDDMGDHSATQDIQMNANDFVLDATTGTKIGTATTQKLGLWNVTPVVQPTALTTQLTAITHTAPGTPDFALQDLVDSGVGSNFGFATKDEGNTLLQVIANLQTRVAELESKLQSFGGLA